ncbi:type IV pilin N-terminal domain-containing protein [Methanocorpusculum vombati]|uniref:Type IV pilin N-terminal domain-containing protein n=1 Tax=Methanocorpusculum vombati TaxID=3002864 RepID=A0ABT4IKG5_9EURY|nr:type IV pilin N-terminal domain-containing protein [Methanocorpusculum vombati]MCZ9319164.1 type IV pilin N-terminal domain-containing protein [Methanocorpusculum sp.]MCZ0861747.1 type IV pilin N-terminal domain-containing protein [Methanocorpusculum vombati]MDE2521283.1 type IV pilin N-terminal domain-containing protein [Methanocorpusculum sp.]MDE2535020.1 type IV pilin N-terminal domain-containing protein [Methanocorpusculum sp.]MDE2545568.1 type IV pilin N-terminal domain-containing prot
MTKTKREDGVSPVVGVMLMLVVTIIIAAMAASFAGGLSANEKVAPQSTFSVDYTAKITDTDKTNDIPNNPSKNNGLTFRLVSGDVVAMKDIAIQLQNGDKNIQFSMDTSLNTTNAAVDETKLDLLINNAGNKTYFAVSKGMKNMSEVVSTGDSITLLADNSYDSTLATDVGIEKGRFLTWSPEGSSGTFKVQTNVPFEYTIFDTVSRKPIQTGTITIR